MKKNLLLLALAVLAPAAFAKDPSFADLQSLESIDGYPLYGTPAEDADQAYIFIDGGAREGKIASIHVVSVFRGAPGFAVVPGKTLAEYLRNGDRSTSSIPCNAPTKPYAKPIRKPIPKARPCRSTVCAACPKWRLTWCAMWKQAARQPANAATATKPDRLIL